MKPNRAFLPLALVAMYGFASQARAVTPYVTPLLIVNVSNPAEVTITATEFNPFFSDSSHTFLDGIDLVNFFATNTPDFRSTIGMPNEIDLGADYTKFNTLTTGVDGTPYYNGVSQDTFSSGESGSQDLNIFAEGPEAFNTENFSQSTPAFTGSITFDLSENAYQYLPKPGTIGAIFAGYEGDVTRSQPSEDDLASAFADINEGGYLIYLGDYEVVIPEPSTWALLLAGAVGLIALRRFRRAQA